MRSRLQFLIGLFGVGAAAQTVITPCRPVLWFGTERPKPCSGQCPIPECGATIGPWQVKAEEYAVLPDQPRLVRCPKCSNAFWQDAERIP